MDNLLLRDDTDEEDQVIPRPQRLNGDRGSKDDPLNIGIGSLQDSSFDDDHMGSPETSEGESSDEDHIGKVHKTERDARSRRGDIFVYKKGDESDIIELKTIIQ